AAGRVGPSAIQSASAAAAAVRTPLQLPWPSGSSGSPTSSQEEPFDFRWFTATVILDPCPRTRKVCASAGRFLSVLNRGSTDSSSTAYPPTGATASGW